MPLFEVDKKKLYDALKEQFGYEGLAEELEKFHELRKQGFNPFKAAPTGDPIGWEIWKEGMAIWGRIAGHGIVILEHTAHDIGQVASGAKLEAFVDLLDELISVPIYLRPFEKMAYRAGISGIVAGLNGVLGKDWVSKIPKPATEIV